MIISVAVLIITNMSGTALSRADQITFGIISTESTQSLKTLWGPLIEDMQDRTGLEIKPYFALDYAGVIQAMRFNKVQLAYLGNKAAIEAVDRASGEVFVQTTDVTGGHGYHGYLITHRDSSIRSVDDLLQDGEKYTFGNGDPNSTSGYLIPAYYVFALNNIDPKTHFKRTWNANHEANALAVANGQVDFATVNMNTLRSLAKHSPDIHSMIRPFWKSPLIPSDPLVWRRDLPDTAKKELKEFFLAYGRDPESGERDRSVLAGLQLGVFRESDNRQLIPIRQLMLFRERLTLESANTLSEEEKGNKLAEIDEQLKNLQRQLEKGP